jgi:hypothetical protein
MATLKKLTRVGADVRQIARLLQAKAPEGHMLAYITPDEAKLLKSQGGSGKLHEDTGVPSFEIEGGDTLGDFMERQDYNADYRMASTPAYDPSTNVSAPAPASVEPIQTIPVASQTQFAQTSGAPQQSGEAPYVPYDMSFGVQTRVPTETGGLPSAMTMGAGEPQAIDTAREPSIGEKLQQYYKDMKPETLQRLGLAGGLAALGYYQSNKAQKEAERAKKEQQALAAPYQQKGAELQRAAQAGELTPAAQQQLQAVQAQAAQQAASRGGAVGQAQTQAQVEAFRSQLLAQQYDYGLKLSGIGDQVALGAIKTGLEADRYVQSLSNGFYTNMANIVGGMPAQPQRTA